MTIKKITTVIAGLAVALTLAACSTNDDAPMGDAPIVDTPIVEVPVVETPKTDIEKMAEAGAMLHALSEYILYEGGSAALEIDGVYEDCSWVLTSADEFYGWAVQYSDLTHTEVVDIDCLMISATGW